jgi:hypothetical protein
MLRTPPLSKRARKARLAYAKRHGGKTPQDWAPFVFSDESAFRLFRVDGRARTIRSSALPARPCDYQVQAHTGADLNPIENIWDMMKWEVGKMPQATSLDELWGQIVVAWNNMTPDIITKLYDSLPRRSKAVRMAKGGPTKY